MSRYKGDFAGYLPGLALSMREAPEGGPVVACVGKWKNEQTRSQNELLVLVHGFNNNQYEAQQAYSGFRDLQKELVSGGAGGRQEELLGDAFWPGDADWAGPLDWLDFLVYPATIAGAKETANRLCAYLLQRRDVLVLSFVGHSMGALLVRRYANHYPDGMAGMVLVGPTHEDTRLFFPADNQWKRVREQQIPMSAEFQELYSVRQTNPVPLGDRPLIVLVGTRADPNVSTPDDVAREKAAELEDQARNSRNSRLIRDPSSGHHIHVDNPTLVANTIEEVVTAAMKGTRLGESR